ncbi:MAG: NUDIX hydrolase [Barnesiella sp.]|nr:NUDIX hydrolase [Barnesiella sp.]MBD5344348.1 NUDIX hydrolase [Bacteroides sp.]
MEKEIKKWKILSSEYLVSRPWLTARRDTVEYPDGRINDEYYVLEYPTWVNVIARRKDGKFVMVEQYRHGLGEVLVELCAGVAEKGESPEEAARRELLEETGYGNGRWSLLTVLSANPGSQNNLSYSFLAEDVEQISSEQHLDATEDLNIRIVTAEQLYEMLETDSVRQSLMAAPLWKYFATRNCK